MKVAVVGGGVSGLTAAHELRRRLGAHAGIDVYESSERPGGLLCTRTIGGQPFDVGAEAFIVRRPEAVELVAQLGLSGEVVSPGPLRPAIWSQGRLHAVPAPAVMGIPATAGSLGDLIDDDERAAIEAEARRPLDWAPGAPVSVGALVRDRFGDGVVARSVDPMLGGVYSALADDLGLAETVPALAVALDDGAPSLTAAVGSLTSAPKATGPVFGTLRGGYRRLVDALVSAGGATVLLDAPVTGITPDGAGYTVDTGHRSARYDAVVVAVPPWNAAPLLSVIAPESSALLEAVEPAGSAVVACVLEPGSPQPEHSGILVASDADTFSKAVTLSTRKWPHLDASGSPALRVSFGRLGDPVTVDDRTLIDRATADLERFFAAVGLAAPAVADVAVQRWPRGIPHYGPGHLTAMAEAVAALPRGIGLAGAALGGVGVPACIRAARSAADAVAGGLTGA
ncbi:MAG: protoporphyrinogen oxidase [Gordonia sp. (in: high G+C Gram-positive bacteria)]|uniref:protoporphyrinogen oxidase n=1 Tax=Gordonia sp. (in: high G+C Gram-positive bacteria) TaxID=84139 RepID=UPI0039E347DF